MASVLGLICEAWVKKSRARFGLWAPKWGPMQCITNVQYPHSLHWKPKTILLPRFSKHTHKHTVCANHLLSISYSQILRSYIAPHRWQHLPGWTIYGIRLSRQESWAQSTVLHQPWVPVFHPLPVPKQELLGRGHIYVQSPRAHRYIGLWETNRTLHIRCLNSELSICIDYYHYIWAIW